MKTYHCPACSTRVFFENCRCLVCGAEFGYDADSDTMQNADVVPAANDPKTIHDNGVPVWRPCINREAIGCNWLIKSADQTQVEHPDRAPTTGLCDCCRYTRTVPSQDDLANQQAWRRLEQAKRYLFHSLHALRLPIPDRTQQPDTGLAFEFLAQLSDHEQVVTGHEKGVITINVAEADDVGREQRRVSLHEPYRTLLGHLRHEIGHFYWDQLLAGSPQLENFRLLFGDERADYAAALQQHYLAADDGTWQGSHISRYASAHPWEDWAETWAHYLHINDALDTAAHWQVSLESATGSIKPLTIAREHADYEFTDRLIRQWLPLCQYLNASCRSLGEPDAYPFILSPAVIDKLVFVHAVIRGASSKTTNSSAIPYVTTDMQLTDGLIATT